MDLEPDGLGVSGTVLNTEDKVAFSSREDKLAFSKIVNRQDGIELNNPLLPEVHDRELKNLSQEQLQDKVRSYAQENVLVQNKLRDIDLAMKTSQEEMTKLQEENVRLRT